MSGGLRNFTSNPHYPVNRWVMTGQVLTGLPEAFTRPVTLDRPGRLGARSLHSPVSLDRPGRLDFEARWLLRPLSLESLTLLGTPSLESLTPPTPFFGSLGSDFHRLCHGPTFLTHNLKETTTGKP